MSPWQRDSLSHYHSATHSSSLGSPVNAGFVLVLCCQGAQGSGSPGRRHPVGRLGWPIYPKGTSLAGERGCLPQNSPMLGRREPYVEAYFECSCSEHIHTCSVSVPAPHSFLTPLHPAHSELPSIPCSLVSLTLAGANVSQARDSTLNKLIQSTIISYLD